MEIGKVYFQVFENGDRVFFVPESVCKNGSYKGKTWEHYATRRKPSSKITQAFVNFPPLWKLYETV
jgi:hypothetical protein